MQKFKKQNPLDNITIGYVELSPEDNNARLKRLSRKLIEAYVSLELRKKNKNGINDTVSIKRNLEQELGI